MNDATSSPNTFGLAAFCDQEYIFKPDVEFSLIEVATAGNRRRRNAKTWTMGGVKAIKFFQRF